MGKLSEFKVRELSASELKSTNGGWLLWVIVGAIVLTGIIVGLWDKTDSCACPDESW